MNMNKRKKEFGRKTKGWMTQIVVPLEKWIETWGMLVFCLAFFPLLFVLIRGCNMAWNNRRVNDPGFERVSYATGIYGRVEYIKCTDGSQEVKIYPGILSHQYGDSFLYVDSDGDGKVDKIRRDGSAIKMNSLRAFLLREFHYESHREEFDKADAKLQDLMKKYPDVANFRSKQ